MNFELHTGPLLAGDLIVIEIVGKIVPMRPDDPRPQWFVVLKDQVAHEAVPLKPFTNQTTLHKARKYVALWGLYVEDGEPPNVRAKQEPTA